jgi:alpha-tubulin suppressor-like RCC1 family protein
MVVSETGDLLTFGRHGDIKNQMPTVVSNLQGKTAAGVDLSAHALVVSTEGELLTFGAGEDGQLGRGQKEDNGVPRVITLQGMKVIAVAAGMSHSMVITDLGKLLTFGSGEFGRLGHGDEETQLVPRVVSALSGLFVINIAAAWSRSMAVAESGEIFTWGSGLHGQLGHGDEEQQLVPKQVQALQGVAIAVAASCEDHSMAAAADGTLYTWGGGDFGNLGHGDEETQLVPKAVKGILAGSVVVAIASGAVHSMATTDEGQLYAWGCGESGQLGHGDRNNCFVPRLVEALEGQRVSAVATGEDHSVVMTESGEVFTFGEGKLGQLGHGEVEFELAPRAVGSALEELVTY